MRIDEQGALDAFDLCLQIDEDIQIPPMQLFPPFTSTGALDFSTMFTAGEAYMTSQPVQERELVSGTMASIPNQLEIAQPLIAQMATEQPAFVQPAIAQPLVAQMGIEQPAFAQPWVAQIGTEQPAFAQPWVAQIETEQPAFAQPLAAQIGTEQPAIAQPWVAQIGTEQPAFAQPLVAQIGTEQPAFAQPLVAQIGTEQPAFAQPLVAQMGITQRSKPAIAQTKMKQNGLEAGVDDITILNFREEIIAGCRWPLRVISKTITQHGVVYQMCKGQDLLFDYTEEELLTLTHKSTSVYYATEKDSETIQSVCKHSAVEFDEIIHRNSRLDKIERLGKRTKFKRNTYINIKDVDSS